MNQPRIDIFDYEAEIARLPEAWMRDMATVFREFDGDEDGKIPIALVHHIMTVFRLPTKGTFKDLIIVPMQRMLEECAVARDAIFLNPIRRYIYYFQMIAGIGKNRIDAVDIQRFIRIAGDEIPLRFCDDFIDEFDRVTLSKDCLTCEEFCNFCAQKKVPV